MSTAELHGLRGLVMRLRHPLGEHADIAGAVLAGYAQMGITALINILLVPLYLNALGRTGFGLLMMLIAFNAYASVIVLWLFGGVNRGLGVAYARGELDQFAVTWAAGKWGSLFGAAIIAAAVELALWLVPGILGPDRHEVSDLPLAFALFFVQLAVGWWYSIDRLALNISGHQTISNLLLVGQQLALGLLVYLVLAWHGGLSGVMAAFLGSHVATLVACLVIRRRMIPCLVWHLPLHAMVRRELRSMISRQGSAYQLFGILLLSLQADILIVGLIGGPAVAAEYALVWKVAEIAIQGLWRIPDVFQPTIIRLDTGGQRDSLAALFRRVDWLVAPLGGAVGLCYAALGHWIIALWVGAQYAPDNPLLYALAGGAIFWLSVARLPIMAGYATGRLDGLLQLMAIEFFAKVALTAAAIGSLGLLAPVAAINLVHGLGVAYGYRRFLRRFRTTGTS